MVSITINMLMTPKYPSLAQLSPLSPADHFQLHILPSLQFQYIQTELTIYHLRLAPILYYYF